MTDAAYLKLILMRHAQSWGNRTGCMEGQVSTALTRQGCEQARRLRQYLHQGDVPEVCYASPLLRALQTAAILCAPAAGRPPFNLLTDNALQEIHPGIFQGLTWAEAEGRYPQLCQQLYSQLTLVPIPQAESPQDARQRAKTWLMRCLQQHATGGTVWVVSHAGLLQHLVALALGCDRTWQIQIPPTGLFEFWLTPASTPIANPFNPERWKIKKFNQLP